MANTVSLYDNATPFEALLLEASCPSRVLLFAVGAGGNPERHLPLLTSLAEHGCTVVAPYCERLASPRPTEAELLGRARRLRLALDVAVRPDLPVMGLGHSIGAATLIALAGGEMWLGVGHQVPIKPDERLSRLVLLTPATGFFQSPRALDAVRTPMLVWAGTNDAITPPAQADLLKQALGTRVPVDVRIADGAGHFSFMNSLPPQIVDPFLGRDGLLALLAVEILRFLET